MCKSTHIQTCSCLICYHFPSDEHLTVVCLYLPHCLVSHHRRSPIRSLLSRNVVIIAVDAWWSTSNISILFHWGILLVSMSHLWIKGMPRRPLRPWYNKDIQAAKRYGRYSERMWIKTRVYVYYEISRLVKVTHICLFFFI